MFSPAKTHADVEQELHGVRFALGRKRAKVADRTIQSAFGMAIKITPPQLLMCPQGFRTLDGVSQFAPAASWQYTTQDLLDAEARLLQAGRDTIGRA